MSAFQVVAGASGVPRSAERLVIVFQCYLDDSGTSGLPLVTMAGFVAPLGTWEGLEPAFDEILNRYEVPVLHAKEFHDTDDCFRGWTKIKKRALAYELFSAAHGKLFGLAVAARKKVFMAEQKATGRVPNMSVYGVCFSVIMLRTMTDEKIGATVRQSGVSFLVESGNKNNGEIERSFHLYSKMKKFEGILRSISFVTKGSCRAIQVADFFAFYTRRHLRNLDRFAGAKFGISASPYLQIIHENVRTWEHVATGGFLTNQVGTIDDTPPLDDLTFWGGSGSVRPA